MSSSPSSRAGSDGPDFMALNERLLLLSEDSNYTLTQVNGQRVYRKAAHAWSGPEPLRDCEVFVGRVPHDCFEDTLVPLFQAAGELFEFRLMINFSGYNRGYGFAMYATSQGAVNAIRMFNNYYIRDNWQLGVCASVNNCRLLVSRIPPDTRSDDIVRVLHQLTDEIVELRVRRHHTSCAALVEYKSHRGAAMARKALVAAGQAWGGNVRPSVDWSHPSASEARFLELGFYDPRTDRVKIVQMEESLPPAPWGESGGCGAHVGGADNRQHTQKLGPWMRERRLRMIQEAQRAAAGVASVAVTGAVTPAPPRALFALSPAANGNQLARQADRFFERSAPPPAVWYATTQREAQAGSTLRPVTGAWRPEPATPAPERPLAAGARPGEFDPWRTLSFGLTY